MTYVILRSGCHECHEPVDLVGAFSELGEATVAAAERMRKGERWSDVAHEVWRVAPGEVEHVLDVDYVYEGGVRMIVTREPTSSVEDEDDCDDEESK